MIHRSLVPRPAIAPRPGPPASDVIEAAVLRTFRIDRAAPVSEVTVTVGPVRFTCLVRSGRVVGPMYRGEPAVTIPDRALALEVFRRVVEAAENAGTPGGAA